MTASARISSRIDPHLKAECEAILSKLGMKPSQAISLFYAQIVEHGGIPFGIKVPNRETVAALHEDMSQAKKFTSVEALMEDLASDAE